MLEVLLEYGDALIGLLGVIVGGSAVTFREWWRTRAERRRDGSYSAIRLTCILEEYADKCIDVVGDDGTFHGLPAGRSENGEELLQTTVSTPAHLEFPDDIAWRSLKESLMHRILALPNKARSTDRYIDGAAENAFPPDYEEVFEARQEGYARLGLEALELVDEMRQQFGIEVRGQAELNTNWSPVEFLRDWISRFERLRIEAKKSASANNPFSINELSDGND